VKVKGRGTSDKGIRRSTTELHRHTPPWQDSNLRPPAFRGEVTLIFTTGQPNSSPGNVREEFEAELLRNLALRGDAPIPQVRNLGRARIPASHVSEVALLLHHR
jgi:hypothetical protein